MSQGKVFIELKDIVKIFPGVRALDGVSFDIREGEVHSLCGENGAGKSTLIKVMTGAHARDGGDYLIGRAVGQLQIHDRRHRKGRFLCVSGVVHRTATGRG